MKSNNWLQRQRKDIYAKKAKKEGYLSRSAFKLIEIEKKFNFKSFNKKYNLILSDIAPNTSGHQLTDHLKISSIIQEIIYILDYIALPNSSFVFKIWKGSEEKNILYQLKKQYKKVSYFKPMSSRKESSEIFIVAENFIV